MYHVRVTTSLLADAAAVADGKLYIHGAGWDTINSSAMPVTHPGFALVLVLEVDPSQQDHIEVKLVDKAGTVLMSVQGQVGAADSAKVAPGGMANLPLALNFPPLSFPEPGTYRFILLVNDAEVHSVKLSVIATAE